MTPSKAPLRFLGTWQMTQCETSRPELPHPTSGITTFTQQEDSIQYENETRWSDGRNSKVTASLRLDGSWCPVSGSVLADSVSFERQDDSTFSVRMKKNGADAGSNRTTISSTGRTMTGQWEIKGTDGGIISWKMTSERQ
jgi:hypothetical protein